MYSDEYELEKRSRRVLSDNELALHSAYHNETRRRDQGLGSGGFCEVFVNSRLRRWTSTVHRPPIEIPNLTLHYVKKPVASLD